MNDSSSRARDLLACLGDSSRFQLVLHLLISERCASDLALDVGLSQSCTTRHLQVLERAGIVCGARDGKRVLFRLCREKPHVDGLIAWALREAEAQEADSELSGRAGNGRMKGRARSVRTAGLSRLPGPESGGKRPSLEPTGQSDSDSDGESDHDSDDDTVLTPLRRSDFEDYLL